MNYQDRLNLLAPHSALKAVNTRKQKRLVLDDTVVEEKYRDLYVNGFQSEAQYNNASIEDIPFIRFNEGLKLLDFRGLINVAHLAYWKPSSYKDSNPVEDALDDKPDTFWQSDGVQPHYIEAFFSKQMSLAILSFYFSLVADESYTPRLMKIFVGHSSSDAVYYTTVEISNVNGWISLTFENNREQDDLLKCQYLRFVFPINHENGKDIHLRGIKVFVPSKISSVEPTSYMSILGKRSKLISSSFLR